MSAGRSLWPLRIAVVVPVRGPAGLAAVLEGLVQLDAVTLAANPHVPRLYGSGVRYAREARLARDGRDVAGIDPRTGDREERFNHLSRVLEIGAGDCDDLACWLAAERRVRDGIAAVAVPVPMRGGSYHVVVRWPDGTVEDPSAELGMLKGEGR